MSIGGLETLLVEAMVPEIAPGESARVELPVEMPLDPARLRPQLSPGPLDRERTNNLLECFFGAPAPTDFACAVIPFTRIDSAGEEVEPQAAKLSWSSPLIYDEFSSSETSESRVAPASR